MINFFKNLLKKIVVLPEEQRKSLSQPEASIIVTSDSKEISCRRPKGKEEKVKWADLKAVLIETNDYGFNGK